MNLSLVTPLLLTLNESPNIERALAALNWAERIVVIDSGSDDGTLDLLAANERVEVYYRKFDTHAQQWNYGLSKITSEFSLTLDADYCISDELQHELIGLDCTEADGWYIPFRYCVYGRPLNGTLLPPRLALFRVNSTKYIDDGHTQLLVPPERTASLRSEIIHDDRKSLSRWMLSQKNYAVLEASKLLSSSPKTLNMADRLRLRYLGPLLVLPYCLIVKKLILNGRYGWFYTGQRVYAEILLALMIFDRRNHN